MTSQLLIAVKSCLAHRDLGYHDIIRSTWGAALRSKGVLLRFFVGAERDGKTCRVFQNDEVVLDVEDDYNSLPKKTRAICQWMSGKKIDSIFLCDNDTYVHVPKLLSCGWERYDYVGKISKPLGETFTYETVNRNGVKETIQDCYPWASGGYGYFLSRTAAEFIADTYPRGWAEDLWVGQVLGPEIANGNMIALDLPANTYSAHFPSTQMGCGYDPKFKWQEMMHEVG